MHGNGWRSRPWLAPAVSFLIALIVLVCAILVWGLHRETDKGDAEQYLGIARSMASGHGYKDPVGLWPDLPAYDRLPGWPLLLAAALKLAPAADPNAVDRFTGAFCLALIAAIFSILHRQLGLKTGLSILGSLAVALSPVMVYLVLAELSEVSFLLFLSAGIVAALAGRSWHYAAALFFGLGALVRTNEVLLPVVLALLCLVLPGARRQLRGTALLRLAVLVFLAALPSFVWAVRNYPLTNHFPVLSSLEGEALYGSNNEKVATDLIAWGYWVVPDEIPGEMHKHDLAKGRTDLELSEYYHRRATAWIKSHLSTYPRLLLGKLIRGFVPVPWLPVAGTWFAFSYRFLLDVLFLVFARWWWPAMDRLYLLIFFASLLVTLATVVLYYGVFRFTHCAIEVLYVPCILLGFQRWRSARSS